MNFMKRLIPVFAVLLGLAFISGTVGADYSHAKSFGGGKFYKMTPKAPSQTVRPAPGTTRPSSGFGRGLAGGLLGGALGGLLFGSMFGFGGTGMGILPLLLLAGAAYFLFKRSAGQKRPEFGSTGGYSQPPPREQSSSASFNTDVFGSGQTTPPPPPPQAQSLDQVEEGLGQIRETDRNFDPKYFLEVASDVFFQVQAGWMRRDLDSYRHLLGDTLAAEYAQHFEEMRRKGQINKLESIAVRGVDIVACGSDGREDFVSVLFTASLLDYIVDDKTGALIEGDMNTPIKFREEWTWARPIRTENWRLEGIREPQE